MRSVGELFHSLAISECMQRYIYIWSFELKHNVGLFIRPRKGKILRDGEKKIRRYQRHIYVNVNFLFEYNRQSLSYEEEEFCENFQEIRVSVI